MANSNTPSLKMVFSMVGAAILFFVVISSYQLMKSIESKGSLGDVEKIYFPVLLKSDAAIATLDHIGDEYLKAVMTAQPEKTALAHALGADAVKNLDEIIQSAPGDASKAKTIRDQIQAYNEEAAKMNDDYLHQKTTLSVWAPKMKDMNADLVATRNQLKGFREDFFKEFTQTLEKTKEGLQWNLYLSLGLGAMNLCFMGVLVYLIRNNVKMMGVIAEQNETLEHRVAERTAQLAKKTNDVQAMLGNMPQGLLTLDGACVAQPEYSAYLEQILETDQVAGRSFAELLLDKSSLGPNDAAQIAATAGACVGEDSMNYEFNRHLLARELEFKPEGSAGKILDLHWAPIINADGVTEQLLVCIRDVTELRQLNAQAAQQRKELLTIGEILNVPQDKFEGLMASSRKQVEACSAIANSQAPQPERLEAIFKELHTLKGNARTYGLASLADAAHVCEQDVEALRRAGHAEAWDRAKFDKQLAEITNIVAQYDKISHEQLGRDGGACSADFVRIERRQVRQAIQTLEAANPSSIDELLAARSEAQRILNLMGTERLEDALEGLLAWIPKAAQELGKPEPRLLISDDGFNVKAEIAKTLSDLIGHLVRNAMDHGIESAEDRVLARKKEAGSMTIKLAKQGPVAALTFADDGRGLDLLAVKRIATEKGIVSEEEASKLTDSQAAELIFKSGFSTKTEVSMISGRGVGMDAVRGLARQEDGDVTVRFLDDKEGFSPRPVEFKVTFPAAQLVQ